MGIRLRVIPGTETFYWFNLNDRRSPVSSHWPGQHATTESVHPSKSSLGMHKTVLSFEKTRPIVMGLAALGLVRTHAHFVQKR